MGRATAARIEVTAAIPVPILWPVRAGTRPILRYLQAAFVIAAVVAAAILIGILLARTGHSLLHEERTPLSRGKG
jgi:hypothetical protein